MDFFVLGNCTVKTNPPSYSITEVVTADLDIFNQEEVLFMSYEQGGGSSFALIVVLFILLIIVGTAYMRGFY